MYDFLLPLCGEIKITILYAYSLNAFQFILLELVTLLSCIFTSCILPASVVVYEMHWRH